MAETIDDLSSKLRDRVSPDIGPGVLESYRNQISMQRDTLRDTITHLEQVNETVREQQERIRQLEAENLELRTRGLRLLRTTDAIAQSKVSPAVQGNQGFEYDRHFE